MKDGLDPVLDVDQVPDFLQLLLLLDVRSVEGEGQQVNRDTEDHYARADDAKLENNSFSGSVFRWPKQPRNNSFAMGLVTLLFVAKMNHTDQYFFYQRQNAQIRSQ